MNDSNNIAKLYHEGVEQLENMSTEEEMDILAPDNEVRHYRIGDKVKLHRGGEGIIRGIMYALIVGEEGPEDAILVRGEEIGDIIG